MHFGENQLSRSLIGLSPLPTAHPLHFQLKWVRSSTRSYTRFNLAMGRSLRFGSRTRDSIALFRLAFATASPHGLTSPRITNSQAHSSKGTLSPHKEAPTVCRHMVSGTISLPSRGTFHHSLTVLSAIGHQEVFSLTRWSWQIHTTFHEYRATRVYAQRWGHMFRLRDSHPLRYCFPPASTTRSTHQRLGHAGPNTHTPQHQASNTSTLTLTRFRLFQFRSPLLPESYFIFSSYGY